MLSGHGDQNKIKKERKKERKVCNYGIKICPTIIWKREEVTEKLRGTKLGIKSSITLKTIMQTNTHLEKISHDC